MKNWWKCEKGHTMWKKDIQRASQSSNFGQIKHILDHWAFWIIFHQILELNIELNIFDKILNESICCMNFLCMNFEWTIEWNHVWARFNVWLDNQNVSNWASLVGAILATLPWRFCSLYIWAKIWNSWKWGKSKFCDISVKNSSKYEFNTFSIVKFDSRLVLFSSIFQFQNTFVPEKLCLCFCDNFVKSNCQNFAKTCWFR